MTNEKLNSECDCRLNCVDSKLNQICDCLCHAPKDEKAGWERDFDQEFRKGDKAWQPNYEIIKSFIRQLLADQQQALRKEILERVEGLIKCTCGCDFGDACLCKERRNALNSALKIINKE